MIPSFCSSIRHLDLPKNIYIQLKKITYNTQWWITRTFFNDNWATGWTIGCFESRQGLGIFLLTTSVSRPALGLTQLPFQWVPRVRRPRREADHSPPSSAEVKNAWSYISILPLGLHGVVLIKKNSDNFIFSRSIETVQRISYTITVKVKDEVVVCLTG
jgi:hypothetical protein